MSKDLFYMVGSQVAGILLGFITNIVLARALGPTGKGYYDLVIGTAGLLVTFLGFSLASGVFYYASKEALNYRRLYGALVLVVLAQALVTLAGLWVLQHWPAIDWLLPRENRLAAIWLIPLSMLVQQLGRFAQMLLGGKARFQSVSVKNVIMQVVAMVLLAALFMAGVTLPTYFILASLVATVVNLLLCLREVWQLPVLSPRLFLKGATLYSLPLALGNFLQFLNYRLDIFIVNHYHGLYTVGVYTLAVGLAQLIWLVPNNLATLILNKAAADKAGQWQPDQVALLSRLSVWFSLTVAVGMAVAGPVVIGPLYGARFQASILPLLLLLPGIVLFAVTIILSGQLAGMGKQIYTTFVAVIAFVCTLLLDLLLIPRWGANGAAVASTCAYTVSMLATWYFFQRIHPEVTLRDLLLPQRQDLLHLSQVAERTFAKMPVSHMMAKFSLAQRPK